MEDEEKILDIVSSYLKKDGYQVFQASTGKQALD
jgi:DNA-binding response OmpR family regulator